MFEIKMDGKYMDLRGSMK